MPRSPSLETIGPAEATALFLDEHRLRCNRPEAEAFFSAMESRIKSADADSRKILESLLRFRGIVRAKPGFRADAPGQEQLSPPSGFAWTRDGQIIVADDFNHRIQIYDPGTGNLVREFGGKGKNPGEFQYPKGVATDAQGHIYVADSWNHRVQKFSPEGKPLAVFGKYGEADGCLDEPYDLIVLPDGTLVVVERYNHRIQLFDAEGASLGCVGTRGTVLEEKLAYLFQTPYRQLGPVLFEFPTSIAKDSRGNFYIADSGNHRIRKFDSAWNPAGSFGVQGEGPGAFQYPMSLTVGAGDLLYAADMNNDRVQIFTAEGLFLCAFAVADGARMPCLVRTAPGGEICIALAFDPGVFRLEAASADARPLYTAQAALRPDDPETWLRFGEHHRTAGNDAAARECFDRATAAVSASTGETVLGDLSRAAPSPSLPPGEWPALAQRLVAAMETAMTETRRRVLDSFNEWSRAADALIKPLLEREENILSDKEDPRVFDREYHLLEKNDRLLFRKTRLLFRDQHRAAEAWGELLITLLRRSPECAQLAGDSLQKQIRALGAEILALLALKEKSDETALRSLSEAQTDPQRLNDFYQHYPANLRRADLLRHLHFELRVHLNVLRAAIGVPAASAWTGALCAELLLPGSPAPLAKILLSTQEDWDDMYRLDLAVKELLDAWTGETGAPPRMQPSPWTARDAEPVAYDSEELNPDDLLRSLWADTLPIGEENGCIRVGIDLFRPEFSGADLISRMDALQEAQVGYQLKMQETFAQLNALKQQRTVLDEQLRLTDVRDKKAPIPIQRNIQAVDFQNLLVRRMIVTLDFNETNNLRRYVACAAIASRDADPAVRSACMERLRKLAASLEAVGALLGDMADKFRADLMGKFALEDKIAELMRNPGPNTVEAINQARIDVRNTDMGMEEGTYQTARLCRLRSLADRLVVFARAGSAPNPRPAWKKSLCKAGREPGLPCYPMGLCRLSDGRLIVSDFENHRLWRFSDMGEWTPIGDFGTAPGKFHQPAGIAADASDNFYVADQNNRRIQKFDSQGRHLLTIGERTEERLGLAASVSVDGEGRIWTADFSNQRIRVFDSAGKSVKTLGGKQGIKEPWGVLCLPGGGYLVGDNSDCLLKRFDAQDRQTAELKRGERKYGTAIFMAFSQQHGIFASDFWGQSILQADGDLRLVAIHRNPGRRAGQFGRIGGLLVAGDTLLASDFDHQRIHCFDLTRIV